jgi:hypothetical protein
MGAEAIDLWPAAGDIEGPTAVVHAGRCVYLAELTDLADGGVHRGLHAMGWTSSVLVRELVEADRQDCRTPPSIAATRPEPDVLTFDDDHVQ